MGPAPPASCSCPMMWPRGCSASVSEDGASALWKGAEGVECAGAVRPERTVAAVESAFALRAPVSGASGSASSGAASGTLLTASVATISDVNDALPWLWLPLLVNTAAAGEAATPRWCPGGVHPEPSHRLHLPHRSLQSLRSCTPEPWPPRHLLNSSITV